MKLNPTLLFALLTTLSACNKETKDHHIKAGETGYRIHECLRVKDNVGADLNRNNRIDMSVGGRTVEALSGSGSSSSITVRSDSFQVLMTDDSRVPKKLAKGTFINHEGHWLHLEYGHMLALRYRGINGSRTVDDWLNTEAYVGIRYEYTSGNFKYGWLRVKMDEDYSDAELLSYAIRK